MYLEYFHTIAEDFMENCHWDEKSKERMREPVIANGNHHFKTIREVIDLAWFDDPHRPVSVLVWDEEAKRKMRQPVLCNGCHHLSEESLRLLVALV
jgi:TPP-dependent indolepyruvate ferredoxin oxidoreductase alpha subunit